MGFFAQKFNSAGACGYFNWLPDRWYLRILFRLRTKTKLNLNSPKTFNEKIQWLKLYDRKNIYTDMVDKAKAKEYVASIIGEEHIIPTIGVYDSFDDIDFDSFPQKFVLKATHDSGGLIICRDKSNFDKKLAKLKLESTLKTNYYWSTREWPYKNVKPRIIAENYMENDGENGLTDYKFFCFNGEPKLLYVSKGLEDHSTARISFFDLSGKKLPFDRRDYKPIEEEMTLPLEFDKMIDIATKLAKSEDMPFCRIDLYSIGEKIKFSEITFSPCSGMIPFTSEEWNLKLGEWINLSKK